MADNTTVQVKAEMIDEVSPGFKKMATNVEQSTNQVSSGIDKVARSEKKAKEEAEALAKANKFLKEENERLGQETSKTAAAQEKHANVMKSMNDYVKNLTFGFVSATAAITLVNQAFSAGLDVINKTSKAYLESAGASAQLKTHLSDIEERIKENDIRIGRATAGWKAYWAAVRGAASDAAASAGDAPLTAFTPFGYIPGRHQSQDMELPPPTSAQMAVSRAENWKRNYREGAMEGPAGPGSPEYVAWREKAAAAAEKEAKAQADIAAYARVGLAKRQGAADANYSQELALIARDAGAIGFSTPGRSQYSNPVDPRDYFAASGEKPEKAMKELTRQQMLAANAARSLGMEVGSVFTRMLADGQSWGDNMRELWKSVLSDLLGTLTSYGVSAGLDAIFPGAGFLTKGKSGGAGTQVGTASYQTGLQEYRYNVARGR